VCRLGTLQGTETLGLETAVTKYNYQAKTPMRRQVAPEAPGARRGAPLKRPHQPGLHQPATCRAACRPSVRCVSHIAGPESLCLDVHAPRPDLASPSRSLHLRAASDVRRAATWAARRTASERLQDQLVDGCQRGQAGQQGRQLPGQVEARFMMLRVLYNGQLVQALDSTALHLEPLPGAGFHRRTCGSHRVLRARTARVPRRGSA